ncbi:MAG TPA: DUF3306 domain-containing protein [Hyphomicrobiaceae bacterium]|jgi:hypothetical protein|nr:DUF3306 domain-containing protein [Hyphomicrobiaceae bacterium]
MSDDTFVARWSRLKRESAQAKKPRAEVGKTPSAKDAEPRDHAAAKSGGAPGVARTGPEPPLDPSNLPPIESIVAGTDVRAFLQKGVPADLMTAALRRAWTTDPAIRDFVGIAENQWDFTNPSSIPGFGTLDATGEGPRLVAEAMGKVPEERASDAPALAEERREAAVEAGASASSEPATQETDADKSKTIADKSTVAVAASRHPAPASDGTAARRKGHGGAMPR